MGDWHFVGKNLLVFFRCCLGVIFETVHGDNLYWASHIHPGSGDSHHFLATGEFGKKGFFIIIFIVF